MSQTNSSIDCIVRLHDASRLVELDRCLFSLYGQTYRPLTVTVVVQRFTPAQLEDVESVLACIRSLPDAPEFQLLNYTLPEPLDARSELLNLGIRHTHGRYLAFLDYDDTLYPEAYELLIARLQMSDAAVAFASVRSLNAAPHLDAGFVEALSVRNTHFNLPGDKNLIDGNFCPLHSYAIDRIRVGRDILQFDPTLNLEEDYDLLLRICMQRPSDFRLLGTYIGDYIFKIDNSNSTTVGRALSDSAALRYEWTRAQMEARRRLEHLHELNSSTV